MGCIVPKTRAFFSRKRIFFEINVRELLDLIPAAHGSTLEIDAIEEQLQGLWRELEFFISSIVAGRPAEGSFFEAFGGDPEAGAIEVEELESVAAFVNERKDGFFYEFLTEVLGGDLSETVEAFAHVAGLQGEVDLERGVSEVDHLRTPSRWRRRSSEMRSAARWRSS